MKGKYTMATKKVYGKNTTDYVVETEVDSFTYTQDFVGRDPNKEDQGTSPTGLLLTSLSGCYLITARSFFNRKEIQATILETDISGDFNYHLNDGWLLEAEVTLKTNAELNGETEDQLNQFIDRYCKVSGVIGNGNNITFKIQNV